MFHSQSLSRKGPLAAIWVAAYCHKRLKKSQVTATDIPFSVDMIMQGELEVVTYRVLGFFLLGIVRIYSKKVEYLYNDCNKVLIEVKGFVFGEAKKRKRAKAVAAPVSPITLPKRFELDAFELDVVDDDSGGNQVPPEDITLRDDMWITERIGHYSLQETQWVDLTSDPCSTEPDYSTVHDVVPLNVMGADVGENASSSQTDHEVRSEDITAIALLEACPVVTSTVEEDDVPPHAMDIDVGVSISGAQTDHEASTEDITATVLLETCPVGSCTAEESTQPDAMDVDVGGTTSADQSNTEATETLRDSSHLEEEHLAGADHNDVAEVEEALQVPNKEVGGANHSDDGEPMTAHEVHLLEKEQMTSCEETNLEGSIENLRGNVVLEKENANLEKEMAGEGGEEPPEERENVLETTSGTQILEHDDVALHPTNLELEATPPPKQNVLETTLGTQNLEHDDGALHPTNVELEATPPLKQTDAQGARTPDFMLVPTPALRERSRTKRKRKTCLFDETIVLPNSVIKRNINDYNDLVCKRKKVPHDALSIWRARRAPNLFLDPLINYSAPELLSLFDEKKLKVSRTLKDANLPSVPEPEPEPEPAQENEEVMLFEDMEVCREANEDVQVPVKVNVPEFQHENELEGIAPETPMRGSPSRRPFESPTTAGFEEIRPESPATAGFDEMRLESPAGVANLETEPSFLQEDTELSFTLMNEEASSSDGGQDKLHCWTGRTRSIMRHLQKTFTKERNSSEEEVVSLLQICEGRTREESAKIFYEILVLKSRGCIEVEQTNSYGDVLIRKKGVLDEAFGRAGADAP